MCADHGDSEDLVFAPHPPGCYILSALLFFPEPRGEGFDGTFYVELSLPKSHTL